MSWLRKLKLRGLPSLPQQPRIGKPIAHVMPQPSRITQPMPPQPMPLPPRRNFKLNLPSREQRQALKQGAQPGGQSWRELPPELTVPYRRSEWNDQIPDTSWLEIEQPPSRLDLIKSKFVGTPREEAISGAINQVMPPQPMPPPPIQEYLPTDPLAPRQPISHQPRFDVDPQEYRPTGTVVPRDPQQPAPVEQFGGTVVPRYDPRDFLEGRPGRPRKDPRGMQALFQRIAEQRAREREAREREARAMALENLSSEGPLYLYRGGIADLLHYYGR